MVVLSDGDALHLQVCDDGDGFAVDGQARDGDGFGLTSMRERAGSPAARSQSRRAPARERCVEARRS